MTLIKSFIYDHKTAGDGRFQFAVEIDNLYVVVTREHLDEGVDQYLCRFEYWNAGEALTWAGKILSELEEWAGSLQEIDLLWAICNKAREAGESLVRDEYLRNANAACERGAV